MFDRVSRLALAGALGACAISFPASAQQKTPDRPNILLIITDDVGQDMATGMYPGLIERLMTQYGPQGRNHPDYQKIDGKPASTPALDRFAKEGMVFTDAWAQPFCSPTRAAMLTGLFAARNEVVTYADALSQKHDSFVVRLKDEGGYSTAVFGKWHMAGLLGRGNGPDYPGMKPKQAGFDYYRGDMNAALPTYWDYPIQIQDASTAPDQWRNEEESLRSLPGIAPTTYAAVAKTDDAIDWIEAQEAKDDGKPWFAWMAFNLAHATIVQQPSAMMIPNKDTLDAFTIAEVDACGGEYGTMNVGRCSGEAQQRAMTNSMDTMIGKIMDVVEKIPNTYVIIVGDNGTPMYGRPNLDLIDNMYITKKDRGKGSAFESGARVEFAIRGPGIKPGSSSNAVVHVADLYATILDMAGLKVPLTVSNSAGDGQVKLDAVSLKPILAGKTDHVRDPVQGVILTESSNLMKEGLVVVGARNRDWKLVCEKAADNCAFYNLVDDPLEEYPLERPGDCTGVPAVPQLSDARGNYCYLQRAVTTDSILKGTHLAGAAPASDSRALASLDRGRMPPSSTID